MRRLFIVIATLSLLLFTAAAAQAAPLRARHLVRGGAPCPARAATHSAARSAFTILPRSILGMLYAGTAGMNGHVYDGNMAALSGATVDWWVPAGSGWYTGGTTTPSDGSYSFTAANAASANGEIDVLTSDKSLFYSRYNASWPDPGPTTLDFQAGMRKLSLSRGGPWSNWSRFWVTMDGNDAQSLVYSHQDFTTIDTTTTPVVGNASVLAGSYSSGAVNFWSDEGAEFPGPITVAAHDNPVAPTDFVDETTAQWTSLKTPYWGSGKPGSAVKVILGAYPLGWTVDLGGYSEYPATSPTKTFPSVTTTGADAQVRSLTVPRGATPGYDYWIGEQHHAGPLYLETPFQVCTFKSTRYTMHRGQYFTLSGVVPTQGHWGKQAGKRKSVTIFGHTGTAGVPTKWNPASKGWYVICTVRTNGSGAFHANRIYDNVAEKVTLVARYAGDKWYWGAFTSKITVTIRR